MKRTGEVYGSEFANFTNSDSGTSDEDSHRRASRPESAYRGDPLADAFHSVKFTVKFSAKFTEEVVLIVFSPFL